VRLRLPILLVLLTLASGLELSRELGFDVAAQTERCATLTATDGVAAPPEVG
jgi:hypothetical protein